MRVFACGFVQTPKVKKPFQLLSGSKNYAGKLEFDT